MEACKSQDLRHIRRVFFKTANQTCLAQPLNRGNAIFLSSSKQIQFVTYFTLEMATIHKFQQSFHDRGSDVFNPHFVGLAFSQI
mmetsp:Transcript_41461/g.71403  ORF Transcript_41461/g.71403 Transcript_41461/m.71403 type:complete len:84 (+) Transcript_41461:494-745(+)